MEVWSDWLETQKSCTLSQTDPVSPTAITNPVNPVSPTGIEPAIAIEVPVQAASELQQKLEESIEEVSDSVSSESTNSVSQVENKKDNKDNGKNESTPSKSDNQQKEGFDLVHGFGPTLSFDIFNKPMEFYQPPLNDMFSIYQEFPVEQRLIEELYIDVFRQNDSQSYYIDNSNRAWEWIRRSDVFQ